jgi:hypothetical protein
VTERIQRTIAALAAAAACAAAVTTPMAALANLAVGGLIRYSRGTVNLDVQDRTAGVPADGLQALGGIRVHF